MFDDAIKYMETYRRGRADQLNNKVRMRWFSSEVATLKALLEKFSSAVENQEWMALYNEDKECTGPNQALQLKAHFLAGCRRDIRMMLAARESAIRTPVDWDRFEFMKLHFHRQKTQHVKQVIDWTKNQD